MLALIMAGGAGSRLNLGEKPLVLVGGQPMIVRVIDAFRSCGCKTVVVASRRTPMTQNWCRVNGIDLFPAPGDGYVEDMVLAASELGETGPLFVSVSDLPCLDAGIIETIHAKYRDSGKDACSSWVPVSLIHSHQAMRYVERIDGTDATPAGVNILLGEKIGQPQEEFRFLYPEPRLAFNVNTRADLIFADSFFQKRR